MRVSTRCRQKAEEKDDLSLLSGMTEKERRNLHDKGIFTVTQLSYTFRPRPEWHHRIRHALGHALNGQDNPAGVASGLYAALMNVIFLAQRIGTPLAL